MPVFLDPSLNITKLAQLTEGYTGSDIKEICREAINSVLSERAKEIEENLSHIDQNKEEKEQDLVMKLLKQDLRYVTLNDFKQALLKYKSSINENSREMKKVYEWNEKFGDSSTKNNKSNSNYNNKKINKQFYNNLFL